MKKLNKKGFTIVELVIVIAVIAILAAVLIPTFATVISKAQKSAAVSAIKNAYTSYLAEETDNITAQKDIKIFTGSYVGTIAKTENKVDEANVAENTKALITSVGTAVSSTEADIKYLVAEDSHYNVVTPGASATGTYYTLIADGDYSYYGTFEGCDVYVK